MLKEIKQKINENILEDIHFEKIIDFFLTELHEKLCQKKLYYYNIDNEYYNDENTAYENFEKYRNKSIIQELFFGVKEQIQQCSYCNMSKYNFVIYKCINILDNKKNNDIQIFLNESKKSSESKEICRQCLQLNGIVKTNIIVTYPKILVVSLNNGYTNKIKIYLNQIVNIENYKYEMIYCIKESKNNKSSFDIIYKENNVYYILKDSNNNKETWSEDIVSPLVLFYKKIDDTNEIINNNILETNVVNINENLQLNNKQINNNDASILNKGISLNNNINNNMNKDLINNNINNQLSIKNGDLGNNLNNDMNHIVNIQVERKSNKDKQKQNEENQIKSHDKINNNEINSLNNTNNNNNNGNIQLITLHLELKNGKELYLEVKENSYFKDVIEELNNKYLWLQKLGKIDYCTSVGNKINRDKTVKENRLSDGSIIMIIEE